jgi:hypothetical protein
LGTETWLLDWATDISGTDIGAISDIAKETDSKKRKTTPQYNFPVQRNFKPASGTLTCHKSDACIGS